MKPAALILLAIFFVHGAAYAEKPPKQELLRKEKKLEDVQRQIREEKKAIREISGKETDVLGELEGINRELAVKREELMALDGSVAGLHREVAASERRISSLESDKRRLESRLRARLRAMYKMGRGEAMELLFSSDSSTLGRRHKYLTMIMDIDAGLIEGYEKTISGLDSERRKKAAVLREADSARQAVVSKKAESEALSRAKLALLNDIKHEKVRREGAVKELEKAAAQLTRLIDGLRGSAAEPDAPKGTGFASMKGRLPMPADGQVTSRYGKVKHPRFNTVTFNNGITIESSLGSPVKSVYDGKVIYVGWLKGYGQVLILDHKGGFYTLYAHLAKVSKAKGEEALRGSEVGLVGDSGPEGRPGLYFEVRQRGVPKDPMDWLTGR
ncbi:MAG: peptidoglycan DD-metalloendopeptidase family protein [Deltaproteobacteria bacterium]|nr:peptidoglycan DD-metalloendopeptidase family protein [Deltaproteobacteria bacterium]